MRVERTVRHHLLVTVFIMFGALNDSIQYQHFAMVGRVKHEHVLEERLLMVEYLFDLEREGLAWPERTTFVEPIVYDEVRVILRRRKVAHVVGQRRWRGGGRC